MPLNRNGIIATAISSQTLGTNCRKQSESAYTTFPTRALRRVYRIFPGMQTAHCTLRLTCCTQSTSTTRCNSWTCTGARRGFCCRKKCNPHELRISAVRVSSLTRAGSLTVSTTAARWKTTCTQGLLRTMLLTANRFSPILYSPICEVKRISIFVTQTLNCLLQRSD